MKAPAIQTGSSGRTRTWKSGAHAMRVAAALGGALLFCELPGIPALAQRFSIDWYKITAGGGTSSNAQFTVSGSVGQHDSGGAMRGGSFSLTSGFWSIITAVQTPGAPLLTIQLNGPTGVTLSWPAAPSGFILQQNSSLGTANWGEVTNAIISGAGVNEVNVSFSRGNNFYRLVHP